MRFSNALVIVALSLFLLPSSAALHCNGEITAIPIGAETIYVDDRTAFESPALRIYLESNGVPGLQSGNTDLCLDDGPTCMWVNSLQRYDPCWHAAPDGLVF